MSFEDVRKEIIEQEDAKIFKRTKKYCKSVSDIPKTSHWAILYTTTVHIPGDERSKTNPGHGYPEHTEIHWNYISFADIEEWKEDLRKRKNTEVFALFVPTENVADIINSVQISFKGAT